MEDKAAEGRGAAVLGGQVCRRRVCRGRGLSCKAHFRPTLPHF